MSTVFVDHYAVLDVPPAASAVAIRAAYMLLAQLYHPDVLATRSDGAEHAGRFAAITYSYSIIKDPKKRQKYDAECKLLKKVLWCGTCMGTGRRMLQKGFEHSVSVECKTCGGTGRK